MQNNSRDAARTKVSDRRALACVIAAVSGLSAAAWANPAAVSVKGSKESAGVGQIAAGERMALAAGKGGVTHVRVIAPDAYKSDVYPTRGYPGVMASLAPRHVAYGEVVLIAESRELAQAAVESIRGEFPWLNGQMLVESDQLPGVFTLNARSVRNASRVATLLGSKPGVIDASVEMEMARKPLGGGDPALSAQWHINNNAAPLIDHGIQEVHDAGITGAGVVVGVLEARRGNFTSPYNPESLEDPDYDFSDTVHPDLFGNFNQELSQLTDPFQLDVTHEVAVAGLIGAVANNGEYGRGVAYGAQLAALRNGSALETAEAWSHALQGIDIINNSWGPANEIFPGWENGRFPAGDGDDDFDVVFPGVTTSQLGRVQRLGLERALTLGRNRNGRILVMAAGNGSHFQGWERFSAGNAVSLPQHGLLDWMGTITPDDPFADFDLTGADAEGWRYSGMMGDRTEYSEQATHPFTFAIAAVGDTNERAAYSTTGTAVLAGGYSGGSVHPQMPTPGEGYVGFPNGRNITTTYPLVAGADPFCPPGLDMVPGLTCSFNGTSAAAPIVSGIFALMLEANPDLNIRDIQHIIQQTSVPIGFDPAASYWTTMFGFGDVDPDDENTENPTFWQVNSADVLHSDEYGFGVIDAEAAVEMARTWPGVADLYVLDTGDVEVSVSVPDAQFVETGADADEAAPKVFFELVPGTVVSAQRELPNGAITGLACIRENFVVETVELTITVEGHGAGDLFVVLESPRGSVSPLAIPRSDSDAGIVPPGTSEYSYFEYKFSSYKHWGELSGGTWNLYLQDYRPDDETPEGEPPEEDEPGEEHVTFLGPLGLPGAAYFEHDEKTLVSFRLKVYGTDANLPPTHGCPPALTTCPGDLTGNGIVDTEDLQLFFEWFLNGDMLADINGDGVLDAFDIVAFRAIWMPGFCNASGPNGRPIGVPGSNDITPIIRPV